jgi:multidrug efflux pump subunit AcrB
VDRRPDEPVRPESVTEDSAIDSASPYDLYDFFRKHRSASFLIVLVLAFLGGLRALDIPIALYPSIDFPRVSVIVQTRDIPFGEMESRVTRPVGIVLRGVRGVVEVRSNTSRGSAEFFVRFSWKSRMSLAVGRVNQAMARLRTVLPPGTTVRSLRMYPSDTPILGLSLSSPTTSLSDLTQIARYRVVPFLSNLPGVWKVEVVGAKTREYHVEVDPYKLAGTHHKLADVIAALAQQNRIGVVGRVTQFHRMKILEVNDKLSSKRDLERIFLASPSGVSIPLREIASIRPGIRPVDRQVRVAADGQPAVLVNLFRSHGENTISIRKELYAQWNGLRRLLPAGTKVGVFYDQGDLIKKATTHVIIALLFGLLSALAIVLLLLRNVRPILLMSVLIPAILCMTLGLLAGLGESLNLMTLGGIAAGVGLVIDDFIVVVEGGRQRRRILRLLKPFAFSGLITIVAIFPLFGIGGVVGAFFHPLAMTFVILLAVSLLVNTLVTPYFLGGDNGRGEMEGIGMGRKQFEALIRHRRIALLGVSALGAGFVLYLGHFVSTDFMPRMDEGAFIIDFHSPPGTSLGDTDRMITRVENHIKTLPDVVATSRRLGTELGFFITEPNKGDIVVRLSDSRSETVFATMQSLRDWIHANEPELRVDLAQILEDSLGDLIGVEAPIAVQIHGPDRDALLKWGRIVEARMKSLPGLVDVALSVKPLAPAQEIRVHRQVAALYGLTPNHVIQETRTALLGTNATTLLENGIPVNVRVLYPPQYGSDKLALERLPIETANGLVPLSEIAAWEDLPDQYELEDLNASPVLVVKARQAGRNLGKEIRLLKADLSTLDLPKSLWLTYGGYYTQQKTSFLDLRKALIGALVLIFAVLFTYFGEWKVPAAVFISTLFAVLVGLVTLTLFHRSLNISSFVGLILVVGIAAENGLLVGDRFASIEGAILERLRVAVGDRLLPLVMTHLANFVALLPLGLVTGAGLDMEKSLAVAVMGGLAGSFFASVALIPLLIAFFHPSGPSLAPGNPESLS